MIHVIFFFGIPSFFIIFSHFILINKSLEAFSLLTTPILFIALILIGIGSFVKNRKRYFILFLGWLVFSIYWATQPEFLYYKGDGDIINASFCIMGVYFLSYISYHEYLSYKRNEEVKSLDFLSKATFFSGMIYFTVQKIDVLAGILIKVVAEQSVAILNAFGFRAKVGSIIEGLNIHVPILYFDGQKWRESVQIILACTGLQSMAVFTGVFLALNTDIKRKIKAFLVAIPTIYILNLIRNAGIVYGMEKMGLDFYMMHNVIGKVGSLIALIIIAFIIFDLLPELYDEIVGLTKLVKRKGPIERMFIK